MPAKGFRTITVSEDFYKEIQRRAIASRRSIPHQLIWELERSKRKKVVAQGYNCDRGIPAEVRL